MESVDFKRSCVETGVFRKNKVNNMVDDALAADVAKSLEIMLLILQGIRMPKAMAVDILAVAISETSSTYGSHIKAHRVQLSDLIQCRAPYLKDKDIVWLLKRKYNIDDIFYTSSTWSRHCDNFLYSHWRRFRHSGAVKRSSHQRHKRPQGPSILTEIT